MCKLRFTHFIYRIIMLPALDSEVSCKLRNLQPRSAVHVNFSLKKEISQKVNMAAMDVEPQKVSELQCFCVVNFCFTCRALNPTLINIVNRLIEIRSL